MGWVEVDTGGWNLGPVAFVAAVASGCAIGPALPEGADAGGGTADGTSGGVDAGDAGDDGVETTADAQDDDGGVVDDAPDVPPGPECEANDDCEPGDWCNRGVCQLDCYGPCGPFECYDDEDCGLDEYCVPEDSYYHYYGDCQPLQGLDECGGDAPLFVPLPLEGADDAEVVSLSFVDANGDAARDLVIGRVGSAAVQLGPGDAPPIPLPVPEGDMVVDAASGDFDGDGAPDIVAALSSSGFALMTGDGFGGFTLLKGSLITQVAATAIGVLDFNGDDRLDAVVAGPEQTVVFLGDGMGAFDETIQLTKEAAVGLTVSTPSAGNPSVFVRTATGVYEWIGGTGSDQGDGQPDETVFSQPEVAAWSTVLVSDFASDGLLLGVGAAASGALLYLESGDAEYPLPTSRPAAFGGAGDADGDGDDDDFVLSGAAGELTYIWVGAQATLQCTATRELNVAVERFAVGDLDGDGRADIVTAEQSTVSAFRSQ